jgi:hypothetical protein
MGTEIVSLGIDLGYSRLTQTKIKMYYEFGELLACENVITF